MRRLLEWSKEVYPSLIGIVGGFLLLIFFGNTLAIAATIIICGGFTGLILSRQKRKVAENFQVTTKNLEGSLADIREMKKGG